MIKSATEVPSDEGYSGDPFADEWFQTIAIIAIIFICAFAVIFGAFCYIWVWFKHLDQENEMRKRGIKPVGDRTVV